jgi:hypothetical protein
MMAVMRDARNEHADQPLPPIIRADISTRIILPGGVGRASTRVGQTHWLCTPSRSINSGGECSGPPLQATDVLPKEWRFCAKATGFWSVPRREGV